VSLVPFAFTLLWNIYLSLSKCSSWLILAQRSVAGGFQLHELAELHKLDTPECQEHGYAAESIGQTSFDTRGLVQKK
jgi:hypothetical protein